MGLREALPRPERGPEPAARSLQLLLNTMFAHIATIGLLACIGAAAAEASTSRLRENALHPTLNSGRSAPKPERVAGYFRLDRTHAGDQLSSAYKQLHAAEH